MDLTFYYFLTYAKFHQNTFYIAAVKIKKGFHKTDEYKQLIQQVVRTACEANRLLNEFGDVYFLVVEDILN